MLKKKCLFLNYKIIILFIFTGLLSFTPLFSQEIHFKGFIKDPLKSPLENANIIATPVSKTKNVKFSIANNKGAYNLNLTTNHTYYIEVSYMGYKKVLDTINISTHTTKNYFLEFSNEKLKEIIITERIPVKIKKDTITYRPEKFINGNEHKLRDILKKLPGMEVDRNGNVKINGKEVVNLLVEGKQFFTGDEKLGVNNIPANVIDEIEAIDNYNQISFLKGLEDSEKLILNIKLKEGKTKFSFGNIELGAGIKNSYLINPTLFYYSPKTSINVIGDTNNTGKKEFTINDYLNFEGGGSLFSEDLDTYFKLTQDDFARFLEQDNFTFNRNNFAAISFNQDLSSKLSLNGYSILSTNKLQTKTKNDLIYFTNDTFNELRTETTDNTFTFSLNKLKLHYSNFFNLDIKYEAFLKTHTGSSVSNTNSIRTSKNNKINTVLKPNSIDFNQRISLNKQINTRHTYTVNLNYKYANNKKEYSYAFNDPVFSNIIPFINQDNGLFNFNQKIKNKVSDFNSYLKHYWILHRFHHIYPEAGFHALNETYYTKDNQIFDNKEVSFFNNGFDNDINFNLKESYFGFTYKAKFGKITIKPSLFYRNYSWLIKQHNEVLKNKSKSLFLPILNFKWEIKSSEKITLKYRYNSNFADISQLANRIKLTNFNSLYKGNASLENEILQNLSFRYSKYSFFKGFFFNVNFNYLNKLKSTQSKTILQDIDQIITLFVNELPENRYSLSSSFSKKKKKYLYGISTNVSFSNYYRIINDIQQHFNSNSYSYNLSVKKINKAKEADFKIGFRQRFTNFKGNNTNNVSILINPYLDLEYRFFNDFVFNFNYSYNYLENKTFNQTSVFQKANTSLIYNQFSSPWLFKLNISNLFNTQQQTQNSANNFLLSNQQTFLQPRIALFSIEYKY